MRLGFMRARFALSALATTLSACSSIYTPPTWDYGPTYSDAGVKTYIDKHLATYTSLMRDLGDQQDASAILTILTAVGGTAALALGAGADVGIVAGSIGAGLTQTNNYAKPHERLQLLAQAVGATSCVRDEFSKQSALRSALGLTTTAKAYGASALSNSALSTVSANAFLARQIDDAGAIAVDATRGISTNLQVKLINVSQVPDYAATVKAIQDAQKAADASKPAGLQGEAALLVDEVSEYEKRIETCKAKLPG
jgi:hypothetical protein